MNILTRILTAWRRQRLALAVRDLAWMEKNSTATLAGQRHHIVELQRRVALDTAKTCTADIARSAERAMKRSLLA
jgi:hypothetical protein